MIVVSNTSPLTSLAAIGHFELLRKLFGEIHIAGGVWDELNKGGRRHPGSFEVESASWVQRHSSSDQNLTVILRRDLDKGESETLALAIELNAGLVLLDEQEARHVAIRLGLRPLGVLGVLLEAKRLGEIEETRPRLDALRDQAGFFLGQRLYQQVLEQAGEISSAKG
jgi:predicted nucleic acid-binding protein